MKSALVRTLQHISERLEQSLTVEEYSHRPGLLQQLDARVKCLTILAMIIAVSLITRPLILLAGYILALILAFVSKIPGRYFITRVWLPLPAITALIALPSLVTTPGQALIELPLGLVITTNGALSAALLYLRVGNSISLALLLMLTTPWADILHALSALHVPDVIVLLLGMTYRYIYVLLRLANDMLLSRSSRSVGRATPRQERAIEGAILGTLLMRSLAMSEEIDLAMRSRGFTGYARTLRTGQLGWRDYAWITALALCLTGIILL